MISDRSAALLGIALTVALLGARPASAPTTVTEVRLTDALRFEPGEITVLVGSIVRWRNAGENAWHTVTADEDTLPASAAYFDSSGSPNETAARQAPADGSLKPGDTFEVTFTILGDYHYFCVPHEGALMRGTIHVVESLPGEAGSPPFVAAVTVAAVALAAVAGAIVWRRRREG